MASTFSLRRILLQFQLDLVREYLNRQGIAVDFDWTASLSLRKRTDLLLGVITQLPEGHQDRIHLDLQEFDLMAGEHGIAAIIAEATAAQVNVHDPFEQFQSAHDKVLWTYLHHQRILDTTIELVRVDELRSSRWWYRWNGIPAQPIDDVDVRCKELGRSLSQYFTSTQSRGHRCCVEHQTRADGRIYFLCYLDDYAGQTVRLTDSNQIARSNERRAFEVAFVFEPRDGVFELYAHGGKTVYEQLRDRFCAAMLPHPVDGLQLDRRVYNLDHLLDPGFSLQTDPADAIDRVSIVKLRLSPLGPPRGRIVLEADAEDETAKPIQRLANEYLKVDLLSPTMSSTGRSARSTHFGVQDYSKQVRLSAR